MIEHLGEATLPISALLCSDGFAERLTRPNVIRLSESIRELTLLQAPIVRASDSRVAAGEDRIAACCLLDLEELVCRLVECSDDELAAIGRAENDCRRNASAEELLAMVEEREAEPMNIEAFAMSPGAEWDPETDPVVVEPSLSRASHEQQVGRRGRKKTERTKAVEAVAADVGRSAEAVRKAAERAERKRENATIETWGREQPAVWLEQVSSARATLTEAASKVQAAMAALTRVADTGILRPEVGLRLYEDLKTEAHALRDARPACVCAWCKNLPTIVKTCTACHGRGYLSEEAAESVPDSLKAPEAVMVAGLLTEAGGPGIQMKSKRDLAARVRSILVPEAERVALFEQTAAFAAYAPASAATPLNPLFVTGDVVTFVDSDGSSQGASVGTGDEW